MTETRRGPNGIPYISKETRFGTWENGEHSIRIIRTDNESLTVNLKPDDMEALRDAITHHLEASGQGDGQEP